MPTFSCTYDSPIGQLLIQSHGQSICRIETITAETKDIQNDNLPIFRETKQWLDTYFSGKKPDYTPQLELCGTDFQKKVWNELLHIDFGHTATYGDIAKRIGCRSAQAVGQAIGKNPILIIVPCHRIIAAGGKLGGFSAGIDRKIWLGKNEGFEDSKGSKFKVQSLKFKSSKLSMPK